MYDLLKDYAKKHRSSPTEAENIFWELTRGKKLNECKFRRQHIIGKYIADFVCLSQKLIVEIDGLIHQLPENISNDEQRTQWFNEVGYKVLRFTNDEVIGNPDGVLQKVGNELLALAKEPPPSGGRGATLPSFMEEISLYTDADKQLDEQEKDTVSLMTIHAAKGLEFPVVFIVGLEENLFPSQMAMNTRADLEEERRLFYVALTRAQKQAVLSYSVSRYKWGTQYQCEPSRFLEELDSQYLEFQNLRSFQPPPARKGPGEFSHNKNNFWNQENSNGYAKSKSNGNGQESAPKIPTISGKQLTKVSSQKNLPGNFSTASELNIQVGMEVKHQRFGLGKVINIEGGYPNQKATVFFPEAGQKQLLLKFAKLEVVK